MPAQPDAIEAACAAVQAAEEKKAANPVILEVADVLAVVDLFAIVSVGNERQLKAVADEVERVLREDLDRRPLRREGAPASGWVLLDYGDVVCHLFVTDRRDFYALERLWADVPRRDPASGELLEPLTTVRETADAP
ncbi:MAG: ribosome silencing factor [Nitriliruptorales bacterium]|nr:ribosome silencing factor [Nitriliruptorales bacterium]